MIDDRWHMIDVFSNNKLSNESYLHPHVEYPYEYLFDIADSF